MILILLFHYEECWMKWDLHVTGEPGEGSVSSRDGCPMNCNLDNHVPSSAVTKSRHGRSSPSRMRIVTEEAENVTDEILEHNMVPFREGLSKEAAQGHIQEELNTSNRKRLIPDETETDRKTGDSRKKHKKTLEWADPVEMSMISFTVYL